MVSHIINTNLLKPKTLVEFRVVGLNQRESR